MKSLQLKRAVFNQKEIELLRKKSNIVIKIDDIERIEYARPILLNYLVASTWFGGTYPGRLQIYLNKKIGNSKLYLVKIKYKEFLNLPETYKEKVSKKN